MPPSSAARCVLLYLFLFGIWVAWLGAVAQGLAIAAACIFTAYYVNYHD